MKTTVTGPGSTTVENGPDITKGVGRRYIGEV